MADRDAHRRQGRRQVGTGQEADRRHREALRRRAQGEPEVRRRLRGHRRPVPGRLGLRAAGRAQPRAGVLGFKLPEGLGSITGTEFGANLSKERTDLLDTDAIVWLATFPKKDAATLAKDKLYASLAVHTEGREVFIGDNEPLGGVFSFVSVLSLPYMLDNFVPMMKRAIDGDPATVVRT